MHRILTSLLLVLAGVLAAPLASARLLTLPAAGAVTDARGFDGFGNVAYGTAASTHYSTLGYRGQLHDATGAPGSGLVFLRNRYYDPNVGHFTQQDPIRSGTNWYAYPADPINSWDPEGLAGYFFDGTGNDIKDFDETGKPLDPHSGNAPTHVAALYWMYGGKRFYMYGVGTRTDVTLGKLTGTGANERLEEMFQRFQAQYKSGDRDVDIFGFSRGAAMAREFANMVKDRYPDAKIRFLGIFDTVAQFAWPDDKNSNPGIRLDIPDTVAYTAHAVAKNDYRCLFPLTSIVGGAYGGEEWSLRLSTGLIPRKLPAKFRPAEYKEYTGSDFCEKPFDGAHSDVGGGYADGSNVEALKWMYSTGLSHGVPLDWNSVEFQKRAAVYRLPQAWHDSRWWYATDRIPFTGIGRHTRRIYSGNKPGVVVDEASRQLEQRAFEVQMDMFRKLSARPSPY